MKKVILIFSVAIILTGCARGCEKLDKDFQMGERNYEVVVFSGGDTVFYDKFRGIVNDNEKSDGIYYTKNSQLIEISGDYIVKSTD